MAGREYYTLMASLPALPYFERAQRLPINEVRLKQRIRMLEPEDITTVLKIVEFLAWQRQPIGRTDREIMRMYDEMVARTAHLPAVRDMIEYEMNQRSIMVALRRRKKGMGPPARGEKWGVGPWVDHIIRNWSHPDFRMGTVLPWIPKARLYLETGQALELELLMMRENWKAADAVTQQNPFAFEAMLAYLFKWGIIRIWLAHDREAAGSRFEKLILEVTGGQEQLFQNA